MLHQNVRHANLLGLCATKQHNKIQLNTRFAAASEAKVLGLQRYKSDKPQRNRQDTSRAQLGQLTAWFGWTIPLRLLKISKNHEMHKERSSEYGEGSSFQTKGAARCAQHKKTSRLYVPLKLC